MGTSTSSRGPGGNSPLVPPWADIDGAGPGPTPPSKRFTAFRTALGRYVAGHDPGDLRSAIGHYARSATGGRAEAVRRFGAMAQAGGVLFAALADLSAGGTASSVAGVDLSALAGLDADIAIQEIAYALTPPNGDAEKIRDAMLSALAESLEGADEFDPTSLTDAIIIDILVAYLRECVFEQIVLDSANAFQKETNPERIVEAERALHDLVDVVVDKHLRPLFASNVKTLSRAAVENLQRAALREVWAEWEAY